MAQPARRAQPLTPADLRACFSRPSDPPTWERRAASWPAVLAMVAAFAAVVALAGCARFEPVPPNPAACVARDLATRRCLTQAEADARAACRPLPCEPGALCPAACR